MKAALALAYRNADVERGFFDFEDDFDSGLSPNESENAQRKVACQGGSAQKQWTSGSCAYTSNSHNISMLCIFEV